MDAVDALGETGDRGAVLWLRRVGLGGFLFFLVKGLAWLALPMLWALF